MNPSVLNIYIKSCFIILFCVVTPYHSFAQKKVNFFNEKQYSNLLIRATGAKISSDLYLADSLFNACLKLNPNSGVSYFELSGIYKTEDKLQKAIEYAEKAVSLSPNNEWYLANLAVLYQENNEHEKSALTFEKLSIKKPNKIDYLFSLTEAYLNADKFKKSIKVLQKIEDELGVSEDLSLQKHQIFAFLKKKKKATRELENYIAKDPHNLRVIGILAEYYDTRGKGKKTEILLQKMMDIDSTNGLVQLSMFQYYMKKGLFDHGFNALSKVMSSIEVDQQLKQEILFQITYDKTIPFSIQQVEKLCIQFLTSFPQNHDILVLLSDLSFIQMKEDTACSLLREALFINPTSYKLWGQLIGSTMTRGLYKESLQDAENAILYHPNQPFPYLAKGIIYNMQNKWDDALLMLKQGKLLVFDDQTLESDFYHQIGDAYYGLKNYNIAFENYDQALSLNENNPILLNNYSYYLALQNQSLDKAENLILKALKFLPDSYTFIDTYGWVLFRKKLYDQAEQTLFKALMKSEEKDNEVLEHYGDALFMLGKKDEAVQFWEKAIKGGKDSEILKRKVKEKKYVE